MNAEPSTSPLLILAAWVIVSIPAAWGVYNTALNAAKLFNGPTPAASTVRSDSQPASQK
jgi:hypothetical protein